MTSLYRAGSFLETQAERVAKENEGVSSNIKHWDERSGDCILRIDWVKFLSLVALASFVVGRKYRPSAKPSFARFLVSWVLLLLVGAYYGASYFYAVEQAEHAKLGSVMSEVLAKPGVHEALPDFDTNEDAILLYLDYLRLRRTRWYEIEIVDTYFPKWLYRTLVERPRERPYFAGKLESAAEKKGIRWETWQ